MPPTAPVIWIQIYQKNKNMCFDEGIFGMVLENYVNQQPGDMYHY